MPRTAPTARRTAAPTRKAPAASTHGAAAGIERMKREQEKADARAEASKLTANEPFRFFIKEGEETQFIVVDDEPSFFRNEHALQNPKTKRFNLHVPCIDEVANCPACEADSKQPYFAMYLTVIDLTPYTDKNGNEIEFSKKMLVVKLGQQKKFIRVWEKEGTLRGALFTTSRTGKMSSNIGSDIEFEEFVDEEELATYDSEYEDKDGKIVEVIGDVPFDYAEIYPDMTEDEISQILGIKSEPSNARSHRTGRRGEAAADDAPPPRRGSRHAAREEEQEEPAPTRAPRSAGRRGAAREEAQEPAPRSRRRAEPAEEQEEPAPRRAPRRTAAAEPAEEPAPRRAAGRRAAPAEEDPPQRSAARRRSPAAEENPLPDEPAPDRASRRAALRGAR